MTLRLATVTLLLCLGASAANADRPRRVAPKGKGLLATERLPGRGVWVDPFLRTRLETAGRVRATVWFEEQLLGDGGAYRRRTQEFKTLTRSALREATVRTLRALSDRTHEHVADQLDALVASGAVRAVDRHWIVNAFSCGVTKDGLLALEALKGVRKIFGARIGPPGPPPQDLPVIEPAKVNPFQPGRFQHPWYVRQLLADRVWTKFGIMGRGTLNIVHDFNFLFSRNLTPNLYRNAGELPANGKDDDGNGLVDDVHGYNFDHDTGGLTTQGVAPDATEGATMHGFLCAAIICGTGGEGRPYAFGVAPEARWAGVISSRRLEAAIEWAILQGADTYSMSFSKPGEGEYRSHRRKVMEHGALCGVFFVSGAGNFALETKVPVQMRQPEDIPDVVFSAAGVRRDLERTPFSSKGPVEWKTEHYDEGLVPKPEVCAFNTDLPFLRLDGQVRDGGLGGNSFAGPMFCGTIALMLSADPELLPWDLREIITTTAMDVAAEGFDDETGHGLINAYRAVKEVLRRKAKREGADARPYTGREPGDVLDLAALEEQLTIEAVVVQRVGPKGQAHALGVQVGDELVSYNGVAIGRRADLLAARKAAVEAGVASVPVILRRGGKRIEFTFEAGQLGIGVGERYREPVFR